MLTSLRQYLTQSPQLLVLLLCLYKYVNKLITYCILILSLCYFSAVGQTNSKVSSNIVQHHLYPNPVFQGNNSKLNVELKTESSLSVTVFDIIGNIVFESDKYYHSGSHKLILETNTLEKGVYIVNVMAGYEKHVKRLIIR